MGRNGYAIGIDLGTSNTVAVLRWPDGRTRPLLFDGQPILPSGVYLDDANRLHVGRDAQRMALLDPARYEPNPKRRIDEQTVLLGDRQGPTVGLLTTILETVAAKAKEACGLLPPAVITHPAAWGAARRGILQDAATRAGWPLVRLLPEPIGAARYFADALHHPIPDGGCLGVFDFGGGTLDVAVVRNLSGRFEVVGSGGTENLGGLDVDAALVEHLGGILAVRHPDVWRQLSSPVTPTDRRHRRLFWEDVRGAKEMLSRTSVAPVPVPGVDEALHVTREELERLARPLLDRAVTATAEVIEACRLAPGQLAGVFLVGGTSRIPLVAQLLHARLGIAPTALEQPELPVAEGALAELVAADAPATFHATGPSPDAAPTSPALVGAGEPPPGGPAGYGLPAPPPGSSLGGHPGQPAGPGAPLDPSRSQPWPEPVALSGPSPSQPWYRKPWVYAAAAGLAVVVLSGALFYYFGRTELPFSNLTNVAAVPFQGTPLGTDIEAERGYFAAAGEDGTLHVTSVDLDTGTVVKQAQLGRADRWEHFGAYPGTLLVYGQTDDRYGDSERTLHVLDAETLEEIYSENQNTAIWHLVLGDRLVRVEPEADELVWIDPATGDEVGRATYGYGFYEVGNWAAEETAANLWGSRFQQVYQDNRLVTINDKGTLRVLDRETGKQTKSTTAEVLDSSDHAMAYQGLFFVAGPAEKGYQVNAYDLDKLGAAKSIFRDGRKGVTPQRIAPCGEAYLCLLNSANELVVVDFRDGRKVWSTKLAKPGEVATILPVGDRIMVNHQQGDAIYNVFFDSEGGLVKKSKGWGAPVDAGSALLFDTSVASVRNARVSVTNDVASLNLVGVGAQSGEETPIGALDARPSTCSWDDTHIACAGQSQFLVYRFRDL